MAGAIVVSRRGGEFLVNTATLNNQSAPTIAGLSNGGFVVSWQDASGLGGDTRSTGIKAQVYDAGGARVGSEFLVNTSTQNGQYVPTITGLSDGGFVVAWEDNSGQGGDASGTGIKAQVFTVNDIPQLGTPARSLASDDAGRIVFSSGRGTALTLDDASSSLTTTLAVDHGTLTLAAPAGVSVTGDGSGRLVLTGSAAATTAALSGLTYRAAPGYGGADTLSLTSDDGTLSATASVALSNAAAVPHRYVAQGGEFLVNSAAEGWQDAPTITGLSNGGFVVAWEDRGGLDDPSSPSIKAQVYGASGARIGSEILVATVTQNSQSSPTITGLSNGGFVVSWQYDVSQGGGEIDYGVKGQVYDASGTRVGAEFVVNTITQGWQVAPTVTTLSNGGFVVAWQDNSGRRGDADGYAIRAQVYDANGARVGGEFLVNTATRNWQVAPTITGLSNGGFVVAWQDDSGRRGDADGYSIKAQVYDASGVRVGGEFLVNTVTQSNQSSPTIASLSDGGFVVAWQDQSGLGRDEDGFGIKAQAYDAGGARAGEEILVNTATQGWQVAPTVTGLSNGGFVVAWQDQSAPGADAYSSSTKAQSYDSSGARVGDEFLISTDTQSLQSAPTITGLNSGGFAVAWQDQGGEDDTDGSGIKAQVFVLDQTGTLTLSGLDNGHAVEGRALTATLTDPDGLAAGTVYTFADGAIVLQTGAAATYTPGSAQVGRAITVSAAYTDGAGRSATVSTRADATLDLTTPTVTGLTSTTPDGAYHAGDVIDIAVGFSEAVTVTGTPRLTLETGAVDRAVDYVSGSGTASLVFRYTVQPGDTAADLDALSLGLNGGTIRDAAGNAAALALPAAGSPGSLAAAKALVIDTAAPAAPGLALAADTGASAVDRLTNDARLAVAAEPGARLRYRLDGAPETAAYDPAALADGTHTVTVTQTDAAGNVSAAASLAFTLDRTAPAVVAITPDTAGPTNAGTLTQTVTLSEAVTGLDAADFALVLTGSAAARIAGVSGSGATYTVTLADVTGDGTLRLDLAAGGTGIQDLAGNAVAGGFAGGATILDHGVPGLTIDPVAGDGCISAAEHGSALVVAGTTTAEDGRTVTLGLAGRTYTGTVAGGAWSVTVPAGDVSALPDTAGTPLVLTADVSDRAGNPAVRATRSLAVDTTADAGGDAALTLDATADTVVNAAEARAVAFTLAGLDPDATAVATFSDGTTSRSLTLAGNGPGRLDLSGLDGTVTGTLAITDRLGNTVTRAGGTLVLDTVAPAAPGLALANDTGPDAGDRVTADPRLTVTPAEAGGTLRTTVDGAAVAAYDPAALGPGAHSVEVVQVDAAGNASAPAGLAFTLVGYFATIIGEGPGNLMLTGSDFADLIRGNAGDDTVRGGRGADYLHGLAGNDSVDGGLGNDTVFGDLGDDRVDGGAGDDQVRGWFGRDTLTGGDGNDGVFGEEDDDLLTGGSGDDYLSGGAGDDALSGEDGDDLLFGNAGNDELVGGAGRDRFAFGRGDGQDVIRDFVAGGAEADVIAFNNGAFADFAGVQAALRQAGADAVFAYGDGDTVTIRNLQASSLTAANFTFA